MRSIDPDGIWRMMSKQSPCVILLIRRLRSGINRSIANPQDARRKLLVTSRPTEAPTSVRFRQACMTLPD